MPAPISKPHATWKPLLNKEERKSTWAEAAGEGKSLRQHIDARKRFIRNANEAAALEKNGIGLNAFDNTVLKKRQNRLLNQNAAKGVRWENSEYREKNKKYMRAWQKKPGNRAKINAASSVWRKKPENRIKANASMRDWRKNPGNRAKANAANNAWKKEKAAALQAQRAADSKANGVGVTTKFGLGDVSRGDELECGAYNIMNNPAGVLHPKGEATTANWIKDHGSKSIEEVLMSGEWAAYFLTTKQKITPGDEIKCTETTVFMSNFIRNPLWRIDTVDNEEQRYLRLFRRGEAVTVVSTYLLVRCVSAFDATGLEGCLQRYIEEMGMPHGLCLHQDAGAGPKKQYGKTGPKTTWVALSLIRVKNPKFADIDPVNPNRYPPLQSCIVTSHSGKTDYKVAVRGHKKKFQGTKSVLADEVKIAVYNFKRAERRNKRKADEIS